MLGVILLARTGFAFWLHIEGRPPVPFFCRVYRKTFITGTPAMLHGLEKVIDEGHHRNSTRRRARAQA